MARRSKSQNNKNASIANLGFEEKLWQAADSIFGVPKAARWLSLGLWRSK